MPSLPDTGLPDELDFVKNREATPDRMNLAMTYLVAVIRAAFSKAPDYEAAIAQLQAIGLERIGTVLTPLFVEAQARAADLRAIYDEWTANDVLGAIEARLGTAFDSRLDTLEADDATTKKGLSDLATQVAANRDAALRRHWFANHGFS